MICWMEMLFAGTKVFLKLGGAWQAGVRLKRVR